MYNMTEKEYRRLERIDEDLLRSLFKTGKGCAIYQLYFESGVLPARYQIKRMKLIFYQYILKQNEKTLLYTFLKAQKENPKRGDWYSEIQSILIEFEIELSEAQIKDISPHRFKSLARKSAVKAAIS